MWLVEVSAKANRKNQILFSKDSLLLTDLQKLIEQVNRRGLILWALELAEETEPPGSCGNRSTGT